MSASSVPVTPVGLLLSDDMIFTSRITGTARDLGLCVKPARSIQTLNSQIHEQAPCCIIVDLGHAGLSIGDFMKGLGQLCTPVPRVVAYGSHVDTAVLRAAREAGCYAVLPRSKFVEDLPRALPDWMRAETAAG